MIIYSSWFGKKIFSFILLGAVYGNLHMPVFSQGQWPHPNAHAHNDYEHQHPLFDALENGFISVEADVHLQQGILLVGHNGVTGSSPLLERLYIAPLDSLLKINAGRIYKGYSDPFYLMIDIKSRAKETTEKIKEILNRYPAMLCETQNCPVKIFLSGNRPMDIFQQKGYQGIALDGRPADLGKGFDVTQMPIVSDRYHNWSSWDGKEDPGEGDLEKIKELVNRTHGEGKKLRLWAIPDTEKAWTILLDVGVDLINSDRLKDLHVFLKKRNL